MVKKSDVLIMYETMEENIEAYQAVIDDFLSKLSSCVASHDLMALNHIYSELFKMNDDGTIPPALLYLSSTFRMQSIKSALNDEDEKGIDLFWNDVSDIDSLMNKYKTTFFMLRRFNSELPEDLKKEASSYLAHISPFVIKAAFDDPTVYIGKPDYIFMTAAMNYLKTGNNRYALWALNFIQNKTGNTLSLISKLEALCN
ncbi:hypothetical protein UYO_2219 [Lachnospiraceae bacterium JC7]|nr:hypothetical protein UYO_2219 [Lachnospiraceae bacterium JC7]